MLTRTDYNETYYNGGHIAGYTLYNEYTYFNETAQQLAQKFFDKSNLLGTDLTGRKVLVLGCAYGFLVKYLISLGVDAYGMDFSDYAISQSPSEISSKLMVGDVTSSTDWDSVRTLAGLTKKPDKFDVIIDEDMWPCLTDGQASTARGFAMGNSSMFIHLLEHNPTLSTWYNWKSISDWKTLLGTSPKEKWYTRFNWLEV